MKTTAEYLDYLIEMWQEYELRPNMSHFHRHWPSTFHNGAFIFEDGSIWWAR